VLEAAGERISQIEMNIRVFMAAVTDDSAGTVSGIAQMLSVEPEMIEQSPFALIGSVNQIVEALLARRERWGFSYVIVGEENLEDFSPVIARLSGS
jgi:septin family protein